MDDNNLEYCLELSEDPIRFEAVNQLTNVFFDDSNKDVFAVRSGGVMGVVVKNADHKSQSLDFRMEDHGPVLSIKFSPDHQILAVQRASNSVEFMNFNGTNLDTEYSQTCKKSSNILGFIWSQKNEVAFITDHGIELYMVIPDKKSLKHLKTTSATVQWFVWCNVNKIALLASAHGSNLLPVVIKQGTINKLAKVDTEPSRMALERDITLAILYGTSAVLILRHQNGPNTAEVHIHTLNGPGQSPVKSHVLKLGLSGRFAINIEDDIILVHHQASRSSVIFDISLPSESDGTVQYHSPITAAKSMRPARLTLPGLLEPETHLCELYSPNWVVFQPNIIIDAKLGCLWHIQLCLSELCQQIIDLRVCTNVMLNRTHGKTVLLRVLMDYINQDILKLDKIQEAFTLINAIYRDYMEVEQQPNIVGGFNVSVTSQRRNLKQPRVLITQDDMMNEVFQKLDPEKDISKLEWLLVSYLTSLSQCNIPAQYSLNELLVTCLARQQKFTVLQQMLQYGVIADSKPLACLLLSLGNMHSSTSQMALDMLCRLEAKEEIQEVLFSEGLLLLALKLADKNANPRKFLTAAEDSNDVTLLHSVLIYLKNNPDYVTAFEKDERLNKFIQQYNIIFDNLNNSTSIKEQ
ncbi:regulator of MON1-CCZ1 complex [Diorhabda carinulata]|uniref:regulator of MON1-CCZ1 complex n=1 Tax=Diorhabda carinulata TaxID=1163345 RepID=UPI0025A25110|nr:regulator of MON1-CCZ1 complex [Diorhabda carinulata]